MTTNAAADADKTKATHDLERVQNPLNFEAVHFLAIWHLERHSYQQARQYFRHLCGMRKNDPSLWLCLSISCAFAKEFQDCQDAAALASQYLEYKAEDVRVLFCLGLLQELRKDYNAAYNTFMRCMLKCDSLLANNQMFISESSIFSPLNNSLELRGEVLLRIAIIHKDIGAVEEAMRLCDRICSDVSTAGLSSSVGTRSLCLKGLLHEMKSEFPMAEVMYRSALQLVAGHSLALERLGRLYLRFRETIPAAVQCFLKAVETNPSNHVAWYLLGRCYSATGQYIDAGEAYNRSVNINPNDAQVWCSIGLLYYASGQYREALGMLSRAVKLDPNMAIAWHNIGTLYEMCGQIDDAKLAYLEFTKLSSASLPSSVVSTEVPVPSDARHSEHDAFSKIAAQER